MQLVSVESCPQAGPELSGRSHLQALAREPDNVQVLYQAGAWASQVGECELAAQLLDKAGRVDPGHVAAWFDLGLVLTRLERFQDAVDAFDHVLSIEPGLAQAHCNRGIALAGLAQYEAAVQSHDRAIDLDPACAQAHFNRGCALLESAGSQSFPSPLMQAVVECCNRAIELEPAYAKAFHNQAIALDHLHQLDAAAQSLQRALELEPDNASFHRDLAWHSLRKGDWAVGWREHEWRTVGLHGTDAARDFGAPQWTGRESLQGKTILLVSEQGWGDMLQFCRFAHSVRALGARVLIEVPAYIIGLLGSLEGEFELVSKAGPCPHYDYHCLMMSLPLHLGVCSDNVPLAQGYLKADRLKVAGWRQVLGERRKLRVGLAWSGNPRHQNDHNRSLRLSQLAPLWGDGIEFVSLQKELRDADRPTLDALPQLAHFGPLLGDFCDTAALCELMDVVISVDTSVAHLAGALGKPVWIMLPFHPDWRWMFERCDSPWYAKARLFRQARAGDWDSVVTAISAALQELR